MQKLELSFSVGPRQCPAIGYASSIPIWIMRCSLGAFCTLSWAILTLVSWTMSALHVCLAYILKDFEIEYEDRGYVTCSF